MKVFISWSGEKSKKVAEILKQWIPLVIQNIEPYFSSSDIDKGARWSTDIAKELEAAQFGILCVTSENLHSSWLNFEAGALSKAIDKARVCPLLIDLKTSEIINSPILQFQMSLISRDDIWMLLTSMNNALGEKALDEKRLKTTYDRFWPEIDALLKAIAETKVVTQPTTPQSIDQSKAIEEILDLARMQVRILKNTEELIPRGYLVDAINEHSQPSKTKNLYMILSCIYNHANRMDFVSERVQDLVKNYITSENAELIFNTILNGIVEIKSLSGKIELIIEDEIEMFRKHKENNYNRTVKQ